jgi:hypothetical protein
MKSTACAKEEMHLEKHSCREGRDPPYRARQPLGSQQLTKKPAGGKARRAADEQ